MEQSSAATAADEGISEPPVTPIDSCSSTSEGYATSLDSLTSETISLASEDPDALDDQPTDVEDAANLKVDSLTLALQELHTGKLSLDIAAAAPSTSSRPDDDDWQKKSGQQSQQKQSKQKQKQRRCSSMKSQKTPPDTPNQLKKVVRFADAFGLDLAYVKHVFDTQNPPVVPPQAMRDLNLADCPAQQQQQLMAEDAAVGLARLSLQAPPERRLLISPCFAQPGNCGNFASRVLAQKVVLERATVDSGRGDGRGIHGLVRVANVGFEKAVLVRVSFDNWRNSRDVPADYVANSNDGPTDQFAFSVQLPGHFGIGDRLVFCVRYCACGETYWDNNFGDNYSFDCFAVNNGGQLCQCDPIGPAWTHFL